MAMRCLSRPLFVCALGAFALNGCGGGGGATGSGGIGGIGGDGGTGGPGGGPECTSNEGCDDDNECTEDICTPEGTCDNSAVADGTQCAEGSCVVGACEPVESVFSCTEAGIRDAVAAGGGPNGFSCDGPQTIVIEAEIAIDNDVVLDGLGRVTVDGDGAHRPFSVSDGTIAELRRFTATGGSASEGSGGGILNSGTLTVTDSVVSESVAMISGGGIANFGMMTLIGSAVSGNITGLDGGGVLNTGGMLTIASSTVSGNNAGRDGGGLWNNSIMSMSSCTVSGNEATQDGGGIANVNSLMISNCTVSGNDAAGDGGGIRNNSITTMLSCTVSRNTASTGGGIGNLVGRVMAVSNSLIDGTCSGDPLLSDSHNVESPGDTCGFDELADDVNVAVEDLKLGSLADNGGPTETHALLRGSVAVDTIPEAMCELGQDQRGVARPQGSACDVGSFELEP
jgi:hypothetical protein